MGFYFSLSYLEELRVHLKILTEKNLALCNKFLLTSGKLLSVFLSVLKMTLLCVQLNLTAIKVIEYLLLKVWIMKT